MTFYAREKQELSKHLIETANLAEKFCAVFGCPNTAYTSGLLHDLGKYTQAFQDYLERSLRGEDVTRGEVVHALQGAKFVAETETITDPVIKDIIGNIIATHHGGLFDSITDGERTLSVRTNISEDRLHYAQAVAAFLSEIDETRLGTNATLGREILDCCQTSDAKRLDVSFMLHLMAKAIFSCLVDADRCNSAGLEIDHATPNWQALIQLLETHLSSLPDGRAIDKVRQNISKQCQREGRHQQGIRTLSVPTGGGKTLSSLRFALEHAKRHGLKRIIYVIPYLSILDQTAAKLHEIFADSSDELIFEHHSNIDLPEQDDEEERYRLLASRWDSPIVLTTMVQFLESIYSNRASRLRKFHNMSEAVLVFDEIQALPIKCIHLFNAAVNFLQTFAKSTVLLCTATQPHLHKTERPVLLSREARVVDLTPNDLRAFDRVHIEDLTRSAMDHEQIAALVKTQIADGKSALVILNTKADARRVYEECKSFECDKAFLTTDLCPAHRLSILDRLRRNLDPETRRLTICISTQLIEAGVDISFDSVIRAEAGMDSIIQAAGRCNRNGENPSPQTVFVVEVKEENLSRLPEIKEGKSISARVFRETRGRNLLGSEAIGLFYEYFFYAQKRKMDFSIRDGATTVYSLLNDNPLGAVAYRNRNNVSYNGLPCAFQTAAKEFSVIEGSQVGVVVPYGDAPKLVDAFESSYSPKEKMHILKHLQRYTVSVYSHTLEKIEQAVRVVDNTFYVLHSDYYDAEEQGLVLEQKSSFLYCGNE